MVVVGDAVSGDSVMSVVTVAGMVVVVVVRYGDGRL